MKDVIEYKKLSESYAEDRLKRYKEKYGDDFIKCDDKFALYLLSEGYRDGRTAGEYDVLQTTDKIQKYLNFLTSSGWSELIDERWKDEVEEILRNAFPTITDEELEEIAKIVFI